MTIYMHIYLTLSLHIHLLLITHSFSSLRYTWPFSMDTTGQPGCCSSLEPLLPLKIWFVARPWPLWTKLAHQVTANRRCGWVFVLDWFSTLELSLHRWWWIPSRCVLSIAQWFTDQQLPQVRQKDSICIHSFSCMINGIMKGGGCLHVEILCVLSKP